MFDLALIEDDKIYLFTLFIFQPFKPHKPSTKDIKDTSKISSYFGAPVDGHAPTNANLCASFKMFLGQEKRGPGRPRKNPKIKVTREQCKSKNKNGTPAAIPYRVSAKVSNAIVPALPLQTDYPRKHKKRKKKDTKEKVSNPELAKEIDELTEFFNKQCCIIEDKRLSCIDTNFPRHPTVTRYNLISVILRTSCREPIMKLFNRRKVGYSKVLS